MTVFSRGGVVLIGLLALVNLVSANAVIGLLSLSVLVLGWASSNAKISHLYSSSSSGTSGFKPAPSSSTPTCWTNRSTPWPPAMAMSRPLRRSRWWRSPC